MNKNYKIIKNLSGGGYGIIKKIQFDDGNKAVIKISTNDDEFYNSIALNEINNIRLIENIPNTLLFYGNNLNEDKSVIILEYCKEDLDTWIKNNKFETRMSKIDKLINDISNILVNIHNIFLLHNDIKLKNILFNGNDFKLIDFGISSFLPRINVLQKHDMLGGTHCIRAPETLISNYLYFDFDNYASIDIWAFCITCISFIIGRNLINAYDNNGVLSFYYYNSIDYDDNQYYNILSFDEFKEKIKTNSLNGYLNIKKIFGYYSICDINDKYIKLLYSMCNLNPYSRIKPHEIIDISPKYIYMSNYEENNHNIYNILCYFNLSVIELLMVYDIALRYSKNTNWKDIVIIIYIVKKYFGDYDIELIYYSNILNMDSKNFIDLSINILNKIEFKIYNPKLNYILDKAKKNKFYLLFGIYNFKSTNISEWFNDITLDYYENNYLNRINYMINNEKNIIIEGKKDLRIKLNKIIINSKRIFYLIINFIEFLDTDNSKDYYSHIQYIFNDTYVSGYKIKTINFEFIDFNILAYDYINILYLDDDLEKNLVENLLNLIIVYIDNIIIKPSLLIACCTWIVSKYLNMEWIKKLTYNYNQISNYLIFILNDLKSKTIIDIDTEFMNFIKNLIL